MMSRGRRSVATQVVRAKSSRHARSAFTLLEMLLVLAVLVAVAAASAPALFGPMQNYRLRKAGDLVRARWARARNEAMKSGRTLMFRFEPGMPTFEVVPYYTDADYVESAQLFQSGTNVNQQPAAAQIGTSVKSEKLPEGVRFVGIEGLQTMRDLTINQAAQYQVGAATPLSGLSLGVQTGRTSTDGTPSTPVLFYPDGTTSTIQIVLGNDEGYFVRIKLRGLSGVAEVTDLESAQELNQ